MTNGAKVYRALQRADVTSKRDDHHVPELDGVRKAKSWVHSSRAER